MPLAETRAVRSPDGTQVTAGALAPQRPARGAASLSTGSGWPISTPANTAKASRADKINNAGQIVGYSWTSPLPGGSSRIFFYQNGAMADLSSLVDTANGTWEIRYVAALNNAGQMVAMGLHDGQVVSNILLTPIQ